MRPFAVIEESLETGCSSVFSLFTYGSTLSKCHCVIVLAYALCVFFL